MELSEAPVMEEVKRGFKNTDVGVIPEDWEVVSFGSLMDFRNGVNADKQAYGLGVPFINVLEVITRGHLRIGNVPGRVTLPKVQVDSYSVRKGDVLFNRTSETLEEVGLASVFLDEGPVVFGGFVIRGRPVPGSMDPIYSGYVLRLPRVRSQIIARGQGAIRANIGQGDLRKVLVPLPPLPEQRAIATALSDVDALLGSLDALIAKKKAMKQGAMQQLLTGKQRLPGFKGEWEVMSLDEVAYRVTGFWGSSEGDPTAPRAVGIIRAGDISSEGKLVDTAPRYLSEAAYTKAKCDKADIVITVSGNGLGKVWLCDGRPDVCASNFVRVLKPKGRATGAFLYYQFATERAQRLLTEYTATSAYPNLRPNFFNVSWVLLPPLEEQTAIATVLSDMDAELEALAARRAKTALLKQGMMQELLTGRTRLV